MIKYTYVSQAGKNRYTNDDFVMLPPEDDALCAELGFLFIVCDGLGSYNNGIVASKKIATWMRDLFYFQLDSAVNSTDALQDYLFDASEKLKEYKQNNLLSQAVSTTICASLFFGNKLHVISVGDCRMYKFSKGKFTQLTEDHSLVWEHYKNGDLKKHEIATHPDRSVLTSAVGLPGEYDVFTLDTKAKNDDIFLMCTDGLTDVLTDDDLAKILNNKHSLKTKAEVLFSNCIKRNAEDDFSFILIELSDD